MNEKEKEIDHNEPEVREFKVAKEQTRAPAPSVITAPRKNNAQWIWIAIAALSVAALVYVLLQDNRSTSAPAAGNEVLGRMDGVTVTKADMYDELAKTMEDGQAAEALDNMMTVKLIGLEAEKKKIKVSEADVDAEIAVYKKGFGSNEEFDMALAQFGMTMEGLREQAKTQVMLQKIFNEQIKPTEEMYKQFYEDNKDQFAETPEQVRASHILLATKEEAEAVLAEIKGGADFAAVAKEKSTDPGSKENGGDLDFFGRGEMNEEFETAAFALKKDELSEVVESPNGFHIIKVTDRKEGVIKPFETVKEEAKSGFLQQEIQAKMPQWLEEKKKEYHYENLLSSTAGLETPAPSASAEE